MMNPQIYHYDRETGEYLRASEARLDPREAVPMVPAYATLESPPAVATNEAAVFDGQAWSVQPDYRGETWYLPDGTEVTFKDIGETPTQDMSQAMPENLRLELTRSNKVGELRAACRAEIFAGYTSSALGTAHHYPLSNTDQANLQMEYSQAQQNEAVAGWTGTVQALAPGEQSPKYREHSAAQIFQLVADINARKRSALNKLGLLTDQIETIIVDGNKDTDQKIAEIEALTW